MTAIADLKRVHRATWAAGDYASVAELIDEAPPRDLLVHMDLSPGLDVLDVATSPATSRSRPRPPARRSSASTSRPSCSTPPAARAEERQVAVDWVEGDAEALPFEDGSFNRVLSVFGVQFAPRHQIVAPELVRVLRPRGRIGLVNWTPPGGDRRALQDHGSLSPGAARLCLAAASLGQRAACATAVRGHPDRARVRARLQPLAVRLGRGLGRLHGDELRPRAQSAQRASAARVAGRTAARRSSRWPSGVTSQATAAC